MGGIKIIHVTVLTVATLIYFIFHQYQNHQLVRDIDQKEVLLFYFFHYSLTDYNNFIITAYVFGVFIVIIVTGSSATIATSTIFTEAHCFQFILLIINVQNIILTSHSK